MPQFDVNITASVDGDCFASQRLRLDEKQLKDILRDPRIPLSIENTIGAFDRHPNMMFCGAGDISFNIQPDGTLSPCCAFPLNCGNVKEREFELLWRESSQLKIVRALRYKDSDICSKEKYCKYCNRCIGQSFVEHGIAENHSEDNCFIAKVRYELANKQEGPHS
jgi:MoaA/NifB/PqqE/SkfB family radical SAM enzyme